MAAIKELIELLSKKPWIIFVILTLAFGYAVWEQNDKIDEQNDVINALSLEVGGLRVEVGIIGGLYKECKEDSE
jgi:hypothetical protein